MMNINEAAVTHTHTHTQAGSHDSNSLNCKQQMCCNGKALECPLLSNSRNKTYLSSSLSSTVQ